MELNSKSETWKGVVGYENLYIISSMGVIKSLDKYVYTKTYSYLKKGKIIKGGSSRGYRIITLSHNCVNKGVRVCRLVAIHFVPNPENKPEVNHINGIKDDDRAENLEWVSAKENIRHAFDTKLCKTEKKVNQYDLNGNFLRTHESMSKASKFINKKYAVSGISLCCNGLREFSHEYKWKFHKKEITHQKIN